MVQRIDFALRVVSLLIVAVASAAAVALDHALSTQLKSLSAFVSVGIVAVSGVLFEFVPEIMIRRWRFVRQMISGDDYIEGTWIEEYPAGNTRESHIAVVTIRLLGGELFLSGITFSLEDLDECGHFQSKSATYEAGSLIYLYEEIVAPGKSIRGSGELFFTAVQGHPVQYQSKIFDPIHKSEVIGFGRKVENESDLSAIKRGAELRSVFERYAKHKI